MAAEVAARPLTTGADNGLTLTSSIQDGIWLAASLEPDLPPLNACRLYRVTGPLDVDALRTAWFAVLERHHVLRSVLVERDGRLWQRVDSVRTDSFQLVDSTGESQASVDSCCAQLAGERLNLAVGPLARLHLLRTSPDRHRLLLVAHQAVVDEPSLALLIDEVSACYSMALAATPDSAPVPDLPYQYTDFARWQHQQRSTSAFRRARDWWLNALAATHPAPTEWSGEPVDGTGGAVAAAAPLRFAWGAPVYHRLTALAQTRGAIRLTILLAAFQALLGRCRGVEQVVVGLPVGVRPQPGFGPLIGPFRTLLAIRGDLSGEPTFQELIDRVDRQVRDALDHRDVPYAEVVRGLWPHRDLRRMPLCQATLCIEEPTAEPRLAGVAIRPLPPPLQPTHTELALSVHWARPGLTGTLGYRPDLVSRLDAADLVAQLRVLLLAGLDNPDLPIDQLPLVPSGQQSAVLRQAGWFPVTDPDLVDSRIAARSARQPAVTAVDGPGQAVTYRELDTLAGVLAAGLSTLEGVAGSPVAIRMESGPSLVAASLGVLRAGGYVSWFSTEDVGERGRVVLTALAPAYLVTDGDPALDPLARWFQDALWGRVVTVDELGALARRQPPEEPPGAPAVPGGDTAAILDRPAYVAFTSGSTGRPKGVRQSHRALAQFATWMSTALWLGRGARVAQWVALEHDPSICEVFATLVVGGTLCPVPARIRTNPERMLDWLAHQRINVLQTVPSFVRELLAVIRERRRGSDLAWLTQLVLMGETLSPDLADALQAALPWVRLVNVYGPTETVAATWHEVSGATQGRRVPVGVAIPGRQVLVVDRHDRPCPPGIAGEIVVRSPYAVSAYLGEPAGSPAFRPVAGRAGAAPEHSAARLACYRTGDLGRWRRDGLLEYAGRRDLQVKLAGIRLELAEVEAALAADESVVDCAVAPVTDQDGLVTRLVAFVVPRAAPDRDAGTRRWRAHLRRRFGHSILRISFAVVDRIPRNAGGKVDRQRLPDPRHAARPFVEGPRGPVEVALAGLWVQSLGVPPADREQSFLAAGGDSLRLLALCALVRERFKVDLPLAECYANPSLAGLAEVLTSVTGRKLPGTHRRERPPNAVRAGGAATDNSEKGHRDATRQ